MNTPLKNKKAKKILLIDDDSLLLRMYATKLQADGYVVLEAANGQEGIAIAKKEKPDLILLDLMMPVMNGIETLKILKKDPDVKNIPVIVQTNVGDNKDDIQRTKEMGALDYLIKSETDLKKLSARVRDVLEN